MILKRVKHMIQCIRTKLSSIPRKTKKSSAFFCAPLHVDFQPKIEAYTTEAYLPGYVWDALNPTERFASVADLCTHIGDQLPVQVVKLAARDVLRELSHLHNMHGIPHNNVNHNNILLSPTDLRALISQLRAGTQTSLDPSEMSFSAPNSFAREGLLPVSSEAAAVFKLSDIESQESQRRLEHPVWQALQAPEALLGAACSTSADMWALGCVLFEILTGDALFDPVFQTRELGISLQESHLIQMIELFGDMPLDLLKAGTKSDQWFTEDGALRIDTTFYPITLSTILGRHIESDEVRGTAEFLETLLQLRPGDRAKAEDILDHPWFSD